MTWVILLPRDTFDEGAMRDCGGACSDSATTCTGLIFQQISTPILALTQPQLTLASMLAATDVLNAFNLPLCEE